MTSSYFSARLLVVACLLFPMLFRPAHAGAEDRTFEEQRLSFATRAQQILRRIS